MLIGQCRLIFMGSKKDLFFNRLVLFFICINTYCLTICVCHLSFFPWGLSKVNRRYTSRRFFELNLREFFLVSVHFCSDRDYDA